jgi:gag-polypeptide of LTR copia-type
MGVLTAAKPADLTIPKLSNSNYKLWSELIVEALEGRGVWDYAEGLINKPTSEDDLRVWRQNNAVATGIIKGALSESQLGHVMGIRNANVVWDTLRKIHQTDDHARVQSLLAEFIRFQLDTTIDEGASKLTRLQSEIGNLDSASKPSDAIKMETLLASLGPEYESTLAGLDASGTAAFEDVVARLKKAEARLKTDIQDQHLARKTSTEDEEEGINHKIKKGRCFHCGDTNHFIKECADFINMIRKQIIDETTNDNQYPGKSHTTAAMTVRRSKGSSGSLKAWGVSQREPTTAW